MDEFIKAALSKAMAELTKGYLAKVDTLADASGHLLDDFKCAMVIGNRSYIIHMNAINHDSCEEATDYVKAKHDELMKDKIQEEVNKATFTKSH